MSRQEGQQPRLAPQNLIQYKHCFSPNLRPCGLLQLHSQVKFSFWLESAKLSFQIQDGKNKTVVPLDFFCTGDFSYILSNMNLPAMGKRTHIMQKKEDLRRARVITKVNRDHTSLLTCMDRKFLFNYYLIKYLASFSLNDSLLRIIIQLLDIVVAIK